MIIENIKINNEKQYQKMIMKSNLLQEEIESRDLLLTSFRRDLYKIIDFKTNINESIIDSEGNLKDIKVNITISMDVNDSTDNYYGIFLFKDTHINISKDDNKVEIFKLRDNYYIEEIFIISYSNSQSQVLTVSERELTFQVKTKCLLDRKEIIELEILLKPYESFIENFNSKNK